jgi:PPOX class probable F420-dependent enzyme
MPDDPILDDARRAFLDAARTATLATTRPDGRPRLVPICFVVSGASDGATAVLYSPLDEKPKATADPLALGRVRDLLARPEATLLVHRWSEDWTNLGWIRIDARADVMPPGGHEHASAAAALRRKYAQYEGHDLETRPILRFTPTALTAWGRIEGD